MEACLSKEQRKERYEVFKDERRYEVAVRSALFAAEKRFALQVCAFVRVNKEGVVRISEEKFVYYFNIKESLDRLYLYINRRDLRKSLKGGC